MAAALQDKQWKEIPTAGKLRAPVYYRFEDKIVIYVRRKTSVAASSSPSNHIFERDDAHKMLKVWYPVDKNKGHAEVMLGREISFLVDKGGCKLDEGVEYICASITNGSNGMCCAYLHGVYQEQSFTHNHDSWRRVYAHFDNERIKVGVSFAALKEVYDEFFKEAGRVS